MIIEYDFNETDTPDAKQFISFSNELHFDTHAKCKSSRDKNLKKNFYNRRAIFAFVLKTIFFSENLFELCDKLKLILQ